MKRILITGKDSYIGTSVEKWLMKEPDKYQIHTIDMQNETWRDHDFSPYYVVFHVAGIAHIKETRENEHLYYRVNRDLAYDTAQKAKQDGVDQFIFLSSMSVYGIHNGIIKVDTPTKPINAYGKSKLEAEQLIIELQDQMFKIALLRPPMVYGKNCKGNYQKLAKFALRTPIFPDIDNKRSMIYIDNLSEFVKLLIDKKWGGIFVPQNAEYVRTSEMVELISKAHGKQIVMTKLFNTIIRLININVFNKLFDDMIYDKSMSEYEVDYEACSFEESIMRTEL
ncbi:MAG: NAD-dependent epimerase/dehydratase family protein [Clostridiales bacterium]|nr:NAD-dependent epimerase/dehydratase family protein [Clostridiales bacterium]